MNPVARLAVVAIGLLALAGGAALLARQKLGERARPAASAALPAKPNVVLLSIDTLRADALGSYGNGAATTPALDRLAQSGVRFAHAYSTSSWTPPAMASLMTGLYPIRHGVTSGRVVQQPRDGRPRRRIEGQQVLPPDLTMLAQVLQRSGYRTYGITANAHLDAELGFARGFDRYECLGFAEADRVLASFRAFQTEISAKRAPYFLWVHLFDPHTPYFRDETWFERALPNGPRFPELERVTPPERYKDMGVNGGERLDYVRALYHGEVRHSDRAAESVLTALQAEDDALIVVVSDHGEEFLEHGMFGHAHSLFEETVRVPLIVRFPDRRHAGKVVAQPVSIVDVLPTIAAAIGAQAPASADGRSLLPLIEGAAQDPRTVFAELARDRPRKMAFGDGFKLIHDVNDPAASALYDLGQDPGERSDLFAAQPERAAALLRALREQLGLGAERATQSRPLDARQVEALRSMGYVQ
jgi:arylsulfatase A-like enzyme